MNHLSFECRAQVAGNRLSGHAAVFDRTVELWPGFAERIAPGAFARAIESSDVRALVNHDAAALLGRTSAGTLRLREDSTGLAFEVDLPETTPARDLRELVQRGDITGASFAFRPGDFERAIHDGIEVITHTAIAELRDVSPVTFPAYPDTDVGLRSRQPARSPRETLLRLRARHTLRGYR